MTVSPKKTRVHGRGVVRGVVALACLALITVITATIGSTSARADDPPPTHRPLRDNQPPAAPEPTDPLVFSGYPDAPAFTVVPRKPALALYPCSQCHKDMPLNATPRKLDAAPHNASLPHGNGRFWCLDCHQGNNRDLLHSIGGKPIDFDASYQLCGQCHGARHRDWSYGGHGKRVAGWSGERQIYACTHCHDPHDPSLKARAPSPPPRVRAGLVPMPAGKDHRTMPWDRQQEHK